MNSIDHKSHSRRSSFLLMGSLLAVMACDQGTGPVGLSSSQADRSTPWLSGGRATPGTHQDSIGLALASSETQQAESASATQPEQLPVMALAPSQVCKDITYKDAKGLQQQGAKTCSFSDCSSSNAVGCVTTSTYMALDTSTVVPAKIDHGYDIAGISGSYNSADYLGCKATGETNCTSSANFPAMKTADLNPSVIRAGIFLASNLVGAYPSATSPLPLPPNTTSTPLSLSNIQTALSSSGSYHFWGPDGSFNVISGDPDLVPANIVQGSTVYNVAGTASSQPIDCAAENRTNCFVSTTSPWFAVNSNDLNPGLIRKDITIAGVKGSYPSALHPLAGNTTTRDLGSDLNLLLRSDGQFEFFDNNGTLHQHSGTSELSAVNLRTGTTVFGIAGSFSNFVDPTKVNPYDVRLGASLPNMPNFGKLDTAGGCTDKADCFSKHWSDVTATYASPASTCVEGSHNTCVFRNKNQRLDWLFPFHLDINSWLSAANHCQNLSANSFEDWRMPSQKEIMVAANNGLALLGHHGYHSGRSATDKKYWTTTYDPRVQSPVTRFVYRTADDQFIGLDVNSTAETVCVRSY